MDDNFPRRYSAEGQAAELAAAIHYPDCWDTAAYPTLASALNELVTAFHCTNQDTHSTNARPSINRPCMQQCEG